MGQASPSVRAQVASLATDVIEGRLSFRDFVMSIPDDAKSEDDLIEELVDLLEHEPKIGRFLGVGAEKHKKYMARVHEVIGALKGI
jgi:hypothetical protein